MLEVEERVNHLDELMAQLIKTVDQTSREMRQSDERSKREMQEFKEEMRLAHERAEERSKREMQEFKEEMRESHDRFAQDMRLAHERAEERSNQEMQKLKKEWNTKWGELSDKLGTIAEDLIAPSIPRILKQIANCTEEFDYITVRMKKKRPREREFDVVAVCGEWVLINETKSTLRSEYITKFYEVMQDIHSYFPEFAEKRFIGAIASLYVDESLIRYGEKLGLIVIGFGEELMDVLNSPGFVPKVF